MKTISTCRNPVSFAIMLTTLRAWLLNFCATEKRNSVCAHHRVTKKAATAFFDGKKTLAGSLKIFSRPEMNETASSVISC